MESGEPSSLAMAVRSCGSRGPTTPYPPTSFTKSPQGAAMHIGKEQKEFEILPAEEEQQPVMPPEPEPQQQPEDAPA
jgi:hypothetical protein